MKTSSAPSSRAVSPSSEVRKSPAPRPPTQIIVPRSNSQRRSEGAPPPPQRAGGRVVAPSVRVRSVPTSPHGSSGPPAAPRGFDSTPTSPRGQPYPLRKVPGSWGGPSNSFRSRSRPESDAGEGTRTPNPKAGDRGLPPLRPAAQRQLSYAGGSRKSLVPGASPIRSPAPSILSRSPSVKILDPDDPYSAVLAPTPMGPDSPASIFKAPPPPPPPYGGLKWEGEVGKRFVCLRGSRIIKEADLSILQNIMLEVRYHAGNTGQLTVGGFKSYLTKMQSRPSSIATLNLAAAICDALSRRRESNHAVISDVEVVGICFPGCATLELEFLAAQLDRLRAAVIEKNGRMQGMAAAQARPLKPSERDLCGEIYALLDKDPETGNVLVSTLLMRIHAAFPGIEEEKLSKQLARVLPSRASKTVDLETFCWFMSVHLVESESSEHDACIRLRPWLAVLKGADCVLARWIHREDDETDDDIYTMLARAKPKTMLNDIVSGSAPTPFFDLEYLKASLDTLASQNLTPGGVPGGPGGIGSMALHPTPPRAPTGMRTTPIKTPSSLGSGSRRMLLGLGPGGSPVPALSAEKRTPSRTPSRALFQ